MFMFSYMENGSMNVSVHDLIASVAAIEQCVDYIRADLSSLNTACMTLGQMFEPWRKF